jgi:hypothetical protein
MTTVMHRLLVILLLSISAACAEDFTVEPGTDLWKELYNPPYSKPTEIPRDNNLRKQLFDLLRPGIERAAKKNGVKFQGELKAFKNWALFTGSTLDAQEKPVAFEGSENSETCALWLRTRDGWKLVDFAYGFGDVAWLIWIDQYGAPRKLLAPE